ncbi:MAG: tetratricopeptide repeat protein [Proteobacteria bacterium]|nr:tetratricopeptide repeat protein [Pseudomonadota bacterium]
MPSFFSELNRRKVFRVSVAYIITAWVLAQVAELMLESFSAPEWVVKAILVLLIIGFPVAAILAWAYELTPEGIKLDSEVTPPPATESASQPLAAEQLVELAHSIAILPFIDLSEGGDHEYFSDGLAEELLNLLTKVPELHVASRTSAFSFKNKNVDIKKVAHKLKVAYILEGSVRKSGNQVRVTTQLIKASDGFHIWSESYDRSMDNIFAVQDEIALAVVNVLRPKLLDEAPRATATDPKAYSLFLQARHYRLQRSRKSLARAVKAYRESLEIAPDYAPSLAGLSQAYLFEAGQAYRGWEEGVTLAREAVQKALYIDPKLALAWVSLSRIKSGHDWNWQGAESDLNKASALAPTNTEVLYALSELNASKGQLEEAVRYCQLVVSLDPLDLNAYHDQGRFLIELNRLDEAEECYTLLLDLNPSHHNAHGHIAIIYLARNDFEGALEEVLKLEEPFWKSWATLLIYFCARSTTNMEAVLEQFIRDNEHNSAFQIAQLYAARQQPEDAFVWLERAYQQRDSGLAQSLLSDGMLRVLYDDPRWEPFVDKIGLLQAFTTMPRREVLQFYSSSSMAQSM